MVQVLLLGSGSCLDSGSGRQWRQGRFVAMSALTMNRSLSGNLPARGVGTLDSARFTTVWSPSHGSSSTVPSASILSRL